MGVGIIQSNQDSPVNPEIFAGMGVAVGGDPVEAKATTVTAKAKAKAKKASGVATTCLLKAPSSPKSISIHSLVPVKGSDLEFIAKSDKLFRKFSKTQAKIIDSEIKTERRNKRLDKTWQAVKSAFHAKLDQINQARQNSKAH